MNESGVKYDEVGASVCAALASLPVSIVDMVDALIADAHAARASDIHLDPSPHGLHVRFRVDGRMQNVCVIPADLHAETVSRIKILSSLRTDEHFAPQDGRFRTECENGLVDIRVSIVPTYHGENVVLRLLSDMAQEFTLDALGFTQENARKILHAIEHPYGMILATGPTGSGKTTTLYTLMKILNRSDVSVITIEDPIEYAIAGVNQIPVRERTGLTFATGLRSMLRQDPNIVMVGEVRDRETAALAVNAALTGHLILSTLHTNDAPTTLPRLLDMHVEPYLIASTVNIAIGQRLVRRVCAKCKTEKKLADAERESLCGVIPGALHEANRTFWSGRGCSDCRGTGYRGRVGIHEVLEVTDDVRDAILRKASARELRRIAVAEGMVPMMRDGFEKAARGLTTLEEIVRMQYE